MIWNRLRKALGIAEESAPAMTDLTEVTALLTQGRDESARQRLAALLYPELKRLAQFHMRRERHDHTLQPTALVSEFYMKLMRQPGFAWKDRAHFFQAASQAMRRLLVDHARGVNADKRGSRQTTQLEEVEPTAASTHASLLEIDDLLNRLSEEDSRMAKVVEMRVFGGLTNAEIADALGASERTVKRDWQVARAWLAMQLGKDVRDDGPGMGVRQASV